jgi:hypothetical protein
MIRGLIVKVMGMQQARAAFDRYVSEAPDVGGVTVGIHEGAGVHPGTNARPNTSGDTVATVGAKMQFGGPDWPARPWLDTGLERAKPEIQQITRGAADIPLEDVLHMIGKAAQETIRQHIIDIRSPPNSQMTKDMKGSSNPLIDSGTLRTSVTYELTDTLPEAGIG